MGMTDPAPSSRRPAIRSWVMTPEFKKSLRDDRVVNLKQHLLNPEQLVAHLRQPGVEVQLLRVRADRDRWVGVLAKLLVDEFDVLLEPLANCVFHLAFLTAPLR